jgi:hypothetical protein
VTEHRVRKREPSPGKGVLFLGGPFEGKFTSFFSLAQTQELPKVPPALFPKSAGELPIVLDDDCGQPFPWGPGSGEALAGRRERQ